MAAADTRTITRIAVLLALAYAAALAGPYFYAGLFIEDEHVSLVGALIAATWTAAPVYVAAALVGASPNRTGACLFLALQVALIASFAWQFAEVRHSSTGGFILLSGPIVQWLAIAVAFPVALAFGWRMRPDFLKG